MSPRWKYFLIGYLWSLPHTLVGLLLCLLVYRARSWRWSDGCIECVVDGGRIWGRPTAQTHGAIIAYAVDEAREDVGLRVHERCHVVQGFIGGPLFIVAYVADFLWHYAWTGFRDWRAAYYEIVFEQQAYARQRKPGGRWGDLRANDSEALVPDA